MIGTQDRSSGPEAEAAITRLRRGRACPAPRKPGPVAEMLDERPSSQLTTEPSTLPTVATSKSRRSGWSSASIRPTSTASDWRGNEWSRRGRRRETGRDRRESGDHAGDLACDGQAAQWAWRAEGFTGGAGSVCAKAGFSTPAVIVFCGDMAGVSSAPSRRHKKAAMHPGEMHDGGWPGGWPPEPDQMTRRRRPRPVPSGRPHRHRRHGCLRRARPATVRPARGRGPDAARAW